MLTNLTQRQNENTQSPKKSKTQGTQLTNKSFFYTQGAKLEADISERIEILNEGRRALITEEDTWHAGKLLEEIRKLLGGDAKGGAPCCGDEDRLKKEEQQEEEEEEDEAEEETEK